MMSWLRRFVRAIIVGGDASELADLQKARREREQRRNDLRVPPSS